MRRGGDLSSAFEGEGRSILDVEFWILDEGRESRRLGGWGFLLVAVCRGKKGRFF
jgi:hypothetical protein